MAAWTLQALFEPSPHRLQKRCRRPAFDLHIGELSSVHVGIVDAIRATSLPRTVLDLASLVDAKELARLLRRAEELTDEEGRGLFDLRDFESLLARSGGHPGHACLDRALRIYRPDLATTRSELGRAFRSLVEAAGLPMPAADCIVGPYEIDAYRRAERFGSLGVEITQVTDRGLEREPDAVMERLRAHLGRRRRSRAGD